MDVLMNYLNSDKLRWNPETHVLILTGDLNDRGPCIKDTLLFAMKAQSVYILMSNNEFKSLRCLRENSVSSHVLSHTIEQCDDLLTILHLRAGLNPFH